MKIIIDRFDGTKKYESTYELTNEEIKGKTLLTVLFDIKQKKGCDVKFHSILPLSDMRCVRC